MLPTKSASQMVLLTKCLAVYSHREFAELVKLNAVAKLPESEFEVDPGLNEMIEAQIKEEEETVRQVSRLSHSCLPCCSANSSHELMMYLYGLWVLSGHSGYVC